MKDVCLIVAIGHKGAIGKKGDLVWHIRDDLKRFKALTTGHTVIMGRKTWESLPTRPLPGRRNIVVTSNPEYKAEGAETALSPLKALEISEGERRFIIGGGEIYRALLPNSDFLYLTEIDDEAPDADTFLEINPEEWKRVEESETFETDKGIKYRFINLERNSF